MPRKPKATTAASGESYCPRCARSLRRMTGTSEATASLERCFAAPCSGDSQAGIPSGQSYCEAVLQRAVGADAQALYPEKQHIVPFVIARQIVNKGGTRATASPANAIGNLTWLSRRQNTLDALADRWTVMDRERDRDNLAARGMFARTEAEAESRSALALYEELQKAVLDNSWLLDQSRTQLTFDAFCNSRAAWMVAQMRVWLEEPLSDEACEWLPT